MAKSRRDQFEEQLRDLQRDISSLSEKLSVPTIIKTQRLSESTNDFSSRKPISSKNLEPVNNEKSSVVKESQEKLHNDLLMAQKDRDDAKFRLDQVIKMNHSILS